jgi:hypothetical protein
MPLRHFFWQWNKTNNLSDVAIATGAVCTTECVLGTEIAGWAHTSEQTAQSRIVSQLESLQKKFLRTWRRPV